MKRRGQDGRKDGMPEGLASASRVRFCEGFDTFSPIGAVICKFNTLTQQSIANACSFAFACVCNRYTHALICLFRSLSLEGTGMFIIWGQMLQLQHIMYLPTYCICPSCISLHIVYIPNIHPYILLISLVYINTFPNILYIPYVTYCTHPSCNLLYTSIL